MSGSLLNTTAARVGRWLASPLQPQQYLELINPLWSASCRGRIEDIRRETARAVTLVIRPNGLFQGAVAGQYVRLGIDVDGVRYWRCYSVTSPQSGAGETFSVTVGRVDGGRVSTYIQDQLRVGDVIALDQASGDFTLPAAPQPLLLISAGTGITPMIGMLRTLVAEGRQADVVHLHFAPDEEQCLFRDELRALGRQPGIHTVQQFTRAGGEHFSAGLLDTLCADWRERLAYVCGPEALMDAVRKHWQNSQIETLKEEAFQPKRAAVPEGAGGTVGFWKAGVEVEAAGDKPLLEVAEEAGLMPKHGCRMGICQECVVPLKEGQVRDLQTGEVFGEAGDVVRICVCAAAGKVTLDL